MKTLYLRMLTASGDTLTQLSFECWRRTCVNCELASECKKRSGKRLDFDHIEISQRWALRNLEYHECGVWLVWKNSRAKKKEGAFVRVFFTPLWCENKADCDKCEQRFYCYTSREGDK